MKVACVQTSASLPVRALAALLSLLMAFSMTVMPAYGLKSDDSESSSRTSSKSRKAKADSKDTADSSTSDSKAATSKSKTAASKKKGTKTARPTAKGKKSARRARAAKIKLAFVASTELRPMAQQLATMRTPAAYAGVTSYAKKHTGEAAAAAYLALGHAYLLDERYADAAASFRQARKAGEVLADYADFLGAEANSKAGNRTAADEELRGFSERYPDSIFNAQVPELEAQTLLGMGDATGAQKVLTAAENTASASRPGFELALAQVALELGQNQQAQNLFKHLLLDHPLSTEAETALVRLTAMGAEANLTAAELRSLGDAYYNNGRYAQASERYHTLARTAGLNDAERNGFAVAAAACDLKLKRLTKTEAEALADTPDENGARRLYLLMELARARDDSSEQQRIVTEMESRFPQSRWLAEALYSSGNMYLLRREYAPATEYYSHLAAQFHDFKRSSAAHWRAGWLSYRQGLYADAARLFDEQIRLFPGANETASALYWRGRLYETQDSKPEQAAANYRTLIRAYPHFFYTLMARQRLATLGNAEAAPQSAVRQELSDIPTPAVPELAESFPEDSPQLAKARLLANAGLNDYISQEIGADPDSSSWSALAEAQIYASYGETFRALRSLKRALPTAASAPISSVPLAYWRILFPEPYWEVIRESSAKNDLDPYLVASLIRQESEFNPSAVSHANAYGLMQLLPAVGKQMAREEGLESFKTFQLLDPATNIRLGTRYLHKTLEKFGGVTEYALAAYNAGNERVTDWQASGPYKGIDEFVESIPFTETREYVQAIVRNVDTYKAIDEYASAQGKKAAHKN
jgi:soluble lytic murein transglycosylase